MEEQKSPERKPDPVRIKFLRSLPPKIIQSLTKEDVNAILFEDVWPDSLKEKLGMSLVMITHDMGIIAQMTTRIVVLYAGRVCEIAQTTDLFYRPRHPYTEALLAAVPRLDMRKTLRIIPGSIPNLIDPPSGCRFHPRCNYATQTCKEDIPIVEETESGHFVSCHEWRNISLKGERGH